MLCLNDEPCLASRWVAERICVDFDASRPTLIDEVRPQLRGFVAKIFTSTDGIGFDSLEKLAVVVELLLINRVVESDWNSTHVDFVFTGREPDEDPDSEHRYLVRMCPGRVQVSADDCESWTTISGVGTIRPAPYAGLVSTGAAYV